MYKLLLCVRYLRTRYIALASIISVTLGVATMIVVNAVMQGFSHEMLDRMHDIGSDLSVTGLGLDGFPDPKWHMARIREVAGDDIEAMTSIVVVPAALSFQFNGQWITRHIDLVGIDAETHAGVSNIGRFLQHPKNRKQLSFLLRESGYDTRDHEGGADAKERLGLSPSGWEYRRQRAAWNQTRPQRDVMPEDVPAAADAGDDGAPPPDLFAAGRPQEAANVFDPAKQQNVGVVLGMALASIRDKEGVAHFMIRPGDDVRITFPTAGTPPQAMSDTFTVVDFYESKMSDFDSKFVAMPIKKLQELRGMIDPLTGVGNVTSIQVRLKPGRDLNDVRDKIQAAFPMPAPVRVSTWRDQQAPILAAVEMETVILNILLFMIIAVAGFGIVATFFMIVVEKTRDIGILKSLGASGRGIAGIFVAYGFSLGTVGSLAGMGLGLLFVHYINEIAGWLGMLTGRELFDPAVYFFHEIPTIVHPFTVSWIVGGALVIAVLASVLPAIRAAMLHPVEALRHE